MYDKISRGITKLLTNRVKAEIASKEGQQGDINAVCFKRKYNSYI